MSSRVAALSLLLLATTSPALAQLQKGEQATAEQVAAGEVPAEKISEDEVALRALQPGVTAPSWNAAVRAT